MGKSTAHYADNKTNNALKKLHNKLRPAGTPVQRVEYIIELPHGGIPKVTISYRKTRKPNKMYSECADELLSTIAVFDL